MKYLALCVFLFAFACDVKAQGVRVTHYATGLNELAPGAIGVVSDFPAPIIFKVESAPIGSYPYALAGCSVLVDGVPAKIRGVAPGYVMFVTPAVRRKVRRGGLVSIVVGTPAGSFEGKARVTSVAPGILCNARSDWPAKIWPLAAYYITGVGAGVVGPEGVPPSQSEDRPTTISMILTGTRNATDVRVYVGGFSMPVWSFWPFLGAEDEEAVSFELPVWVKQAGVVGIVPIQVEADGRRSNTLRINVR